MIVLTGQHVTNNGGFSQHMQDLSKPFMLGDVGLPPTVVLTGPNMFLCPGDQHETNNGGSLDRVATP